MTRLQMRLCAVLLSVGLLGFTAAWALQAEAASHLGRARELNATEAPGGDAGPPDLSKYREVLARLRESIEIRRTVDRRIAVIERRVAALGRAQELAGQVEDSTRSELRRIEVLLDGALGASRSGMKGLVALDRGLRVSRRLAWRIARELEELDQRLGPTIGRAR